MDIKSIKTCFYVAKFFAITPSSIYDKPTKLYQKLYPVLMFLIYTITEIYSVYERRYMNAHLSGIQLVVRNLLDISLYLNAYHVFVTMMTLKRHKWSTLFEILLKLESKDLSRTFYGFVIVAHLLFLVIFVLNIWCWIVEIGGWLAFTKQLLIKFVEVYPLFVLLIVSNVVLKILVEKYRHQKNFINESNVETVKFNLFLLSQAVETFNDIFGWTILQTVFFTVPRVLMYFDIFITEHESKPNWLFFLANFLTNLLFWILLLYVIYLCDLVVKEFDQIVNVAYRMETWNVVFNGSRKNLDVMKSFVNFRPSFTAARFFEIDRSTIFSICNALASFLIIIIQFKMNTEDSKTKPFTQKTVYYTLNFFFVLLLFSGYLPVQGLFASPIHLKFKYFSREFFYSLYIIVVACIMHFLRLYHYFTIKNDKITLRELIFMCTAFLSLVFFLQLARKWPRLIQKWCHLDEKFNVTYSYPKYLKLQLTLVTSIYLLIVFGEYFYFMSVKLDGSENTFQKVVEKIYFYIFAHIPYNIAVVLVIVLPIFSNFIALSLIDVFVILVSITITFRFQQINELLKEQKNKNNSINFWMTVRRNYSEIGRLVSEINDTISSITVLSYGSNMILLINELSSFIGNVVVEESKCFYVYSFLVLIIRLLSVYYFSSRINAESRKPIRILFDVSSEIYNVEIKRWFMQMKLDSVALTVAIAISLKRRFQQITQRIVNHKEQYKNVEFWRNIREDYDRLARLTQFLDKELSYLILFSIGFNCFWVMKLLYNVLRFGAESQTINFMFSFGFILLRFLSVFESCTRLNNESRKPSFVIQFSHIPVDNIENISTDFWQEIRNHYDLLSHMVRHFDKEVSYLILASVGFNGFWVLLFFYKSYTAKFSSSANLYFAYPFGYIILRFLLLFHCGALLNEESKKPAIIIHFSEIPVLNTEITRLLTQIEFDNVFLSGGKIFRMKSGILLSVVGATVTYELTIVQYNIFSN
ncbi:hypothetical protein TcasGA2_TC031155 [Tribolium castaneum]|uniref:Gustatory receptor n=1 Tax=Tribolium castaneum TaxID=7070 RepID=A0A139WHH1_TRICA|nr:hypothetical protein TcasGA2_TC031155 [Tribolium castaneum]